MTNPKRIQLHPKERVVFHLRRHWFIMFKNIAFFLLLAIIPAILYSFYSTEVVLWLDSPTASALLITGTSSYYLFIWLFLFFRWADYYLDVWTITNQRIIGKRQLGLFSREVSELTLDDVEDATADVAGFFKTFLHFGDVRVQTAGERDNLNISDVYNPYEINRKIIKLSHEAKFKPENQR